jgi:hypothetical protein
MLLCFQIRVNFTLVLCIACYHFEFGIAVLEALENIDCAVFILHSRRLTCLT